MEASMNNTNTYFYIAHRIGKAPYLRSSVH